MNRESSALIRYRWWIIVGFLGVSVFFALQIPRATVEPNMKSMLPQNMPARLNTERIEEIFGGTEMIMVLLRTEDVLRPETLRRVKELSRRMKRIHGVEKVLSLFDLMHIRGEGNMMVVERAVRRIPRTEAQREALRERLRSNELVYGSVVSKDFTTTAVIGLLSTDVVDETIVGQIQALVEDVPGDEETFIGGMPAIRVQISRDIQRDLKRLLPWGLLIMVIFLFLCFRQLRGVILPFLVVIMSILVTMGLIPTLGWKIYVISILVPIILIAVANDYGIHLIARYQEENVPGSPRSQQDLAVRIFRALGKPILFTGITTIAGLLCLLGHIIVPARQVGILASVGVLFALAASLFFIPAVMSLLPRAKPILSAEGEGSQRHGLERLLAGLAQRVTAYPRGILLMAFLLAAVASGGIFSVVIDTDPNSYYPEDNPLVVASRLIDRKLGGGQTLALVFQGDIKDPQVMRDIDRLEQQLRELPEVGTTTSIARVIRQMSRALNNPGEPGYDAIPDSRNAIAQYLELYSMSGDPEDFEKMVDFDYRHALLTARITTTSTERLNRVVEEVRAWTRGDPHVTLLGGFGMILAELAHAIVRGQLLSLGLAVVLVATLVMLLFRSVIAGLIGAIPLGLAVVLLFGLMGVFGIELNIATTMLSSIMIGVGVDYTIHFLWRYREERREGLPAEQAVRKTLTTTGRGIVFNALSVVVGFVILMISSFLPVRFFGFLILVSILTCLFGALILVPAICLVFRPKFLEPKS